MKVLRYDIYGNVYPVGLQVRVAKNFPKMQRGTPGTRCYNTILPHFFKKNKLEQQKNENMANYYIKKSTINQFICFLRKMGIIKDNTVVDRILRRPFLFVSPPAATI
jgi:hypothetical protein